MSDAVMVPRVLKSDWLLEQAQSLSASKREDAVKALAWNLRVHHTRLVAASTPVGGWEDISTHDGCESHVLIAETDGSVLEARLLDDGRGWWARGNDPTDHWGEELFPTHWMPLPPPPSVSTDNGSRPQEAVPTEQAEPAVVEPTEAMCDAARGLIMMDRFGLPNAKTPLSECARSGFYGEHWAHILDDDEREYGHRLPKGHLASLIWRAMESARRKQPADGCPSNEGAA